MTNDPRDANDSPQSQRPANGLIFYSDENSATIPVPPPPLVSATMAQRRVTGRKNKVGEWLWVLVAGALLAVILVGSLGAVIFVQASQANGIASVMTVTPEILPTAVLAYRHFDNIVLGESLALPDGSSIELVPWDGESRFTTIVVGLDRRPGDTGLLYRTDTMMLVSLDPNTNQIGVLSIPRDLFVQIPGYSQLQRINTALVLGESQQQGNGPDLMMQTVQWNFGIRVHDFIAVDFQAFIDVVDVIGGIDITTTTIINDPQYPNMNYGYDPFYLPVGEHHLNGYDALRFARTRHGSSDINRAQRQQQVIGAIRDRILTLDMVSTFIGQVPLLWQSWEDNVYTGLSLEQLIQLGLFAKDIPRENITMDVMSFEYLQGYTTASGAQVLIPNRNQLGNLMVHVFGADYSK